MLIYCSCYFSLIVQVIVNMVVLDCYYQGCELEFKIQKSLNLTSKIVDEVLNLS